MTKKLELIWRGSITDLATDLAYLLTPEQGEALTKELERFLRKDRTKFQGNMK